MAAVEFHGRQLGLAGSHAVAEYLSHSTAFTRACRAMDNITASHEPIRVAPAALKGETGATGTAGAVAAMPACHCENAAAFAPFPPY